MIVGVLALQGAFREHRKAFERVGAEVREVRLPGHLQGLAGIVIPGGESTTMAKLMVAYGMDAALRSFHRDGGAIWGTCAGAIAVAEEIVGYPAQPRLGLLDISVERNAYGRQVASFEADIAFDGLSAPFHAIFIRAPRIASTGPGTMTVAVYEGDAVAVTAERLLATVFHPELSGDDRIHRFFLESVCTPTG